MATEAAVAVTVAAATEEWEVVAWEAVVRSSSPTFVLTPTVQRASLTKTPSFLSKSAGKTSKTCSAKLVSAQAYRQNEKAID